MSEDFDYQMAKFCIITGMAPSEYMNLTLGQRQAFIEAYQDIHS